MSTIALHSSEGKWLMVAAILASSMAFIDATALNVVLPSLQKNLEATGADLFWVLNAYLLMLAALMLIGGSLGDKLGRKKIFMAGILIFMVGSVACGFAPNVVFLIAFRAIQGVGGALMIPGSLSLISSSIQGKERGKAIGTWSAFTTVVTMGGPILGGALADAGLWRYIFFINVPIGLGSLLILWGKVKESKDLDSGRALDIPGALSIALSLAFLTFGFLRMPAIGFWNVQVYSTLAAGLALFAVFIGIENKSKHPMMPLSLFKNPTFSGVNLLTFFLYAGLGAGMLFLSLNLVQVQGYSQLQSGLTFLPFTILMLSIARFAGRLADKYGPRLFLIIGPATAGTGLLLLSFIGQTAGPHDYWFTFFPGILVFGLGMSFTVVPLTATVMGSVSENFSGIASGINNAVTRISTVFANAAFGSLAILFFSAALQQQIKHLPLGPQDQKAVIAQVINLGNAKAPPGISPAAKDAVIKSYHLSFLYGYAIILRVSAALGYLGALLSFIFIRNKVVKKPDT